MSTAELILAIVTAIIAAIPPTLVALAAYHASMRAATVSEKTRDTVNGRMSEMLQIVAAKARAEGKLEADVDASRTKFTMP